MAKANFRGWFHSFKIKLYRAVGFAFLVLMFGCATQPGTIPVHRVELDQPSLVKTCNRGEREIEPDLLGCSRWAGEVCEVFTLPKWVFDQRQEIDPERTGFFEVLGHEVYHCEAGHFHGIPPRGVALPRVPARGL